MMINLDPMLLLLTAPTFDQAPQHAVDRPASLSGCGLQAQDSG